jgi:hypothetical protein
MATNEVLLSVALLIFVVWAITDVAYKLQLIRKLKADMAQRSHYMPDGY